jgi:hypothetical protein
MRQNNHLDPLEQVFLHGNPNPDRIGCPDQETLQALARRELPLTHEALIHVAKCSECFRDVKAYQARYRRRKRRALYACAAAAVLVLCVSGSVVWLVREHREHAASAALAVAFISYDASQAFGTRGEEAPQATKPIELVRARSVHLSITLPLRLHPGDYDTRLCHINNPNPVCFSTGRAAVNETSHRSILETTLRTDQLPSGEYVFFFQRSGDIEWGPLPARLK